MSGEYQPITPNESGHLWSRQLDLYLTVHESKLRFFMAEGDLVPTPEEAAKAAEHTSEQAQQQIEQAQQQVEQAQQQADRLAQRCRELGVDPDTV
ncbi:MAG: hypothetical protein AAGE59_13130 [Cyanobacteria bacterium P01_F01_bin.86]